MKYRNVHTYSPTFFDNLFRTSPPFSLITLSKLLLSSQSLATTNFFLSRILVVGLVGIDDKALVTSTFPRRCFFFAGLSTVCFEPRSSIDISPLNTFCRLSQSITSAWWLAMFVPLGFLSARMWAWCSRKRNLIS